jgi:hypothetical protein
VIAAFRQSNGRSGAEGACPGSGSSGGFTPNGSTMKMTIHQTIK